MCTTVNVARWFLVDGMRRVTGKRPSSGAVESRVGAVRRVLFEPIDHRQTALDLEAENREIRHEAAARWNFDFATETPLEGRFEWSPVGEGEAVHPSYDLRSTHLRHLPTTNLVASPPASATTTVTEVSTSSDTASSTEKPLCVSPTSKGAGSSKKPIQRKVTDFMMQRKRTAVKTSTPTKSSPKSKVRRTATTTSPTT